MATDVIVARSTSKWGGSCRDCRLPILKGNPVFKIAEEGSTTKHGQGPGRWVCATCKENYGQ